MMQSKYIVMLLIFFTSHVIYSQVFSGHENLIGGIWKGDGSWANGAPFKQSVKYFWGLNKQFVKTETYGNIKKEGIEIGLRNEGLRYKDSGTAELKFIELDIFGGVTTGAISYEGKNLYYSYLYKSGSQEMLLTDAWEYVDDNTYTYTVGIFKDGEWKQKFLSTTMTRFKKWHTN